MAKNKKNYLKFKQGYNVGHLGATVAEEDGNLAMYYVSEETYVKRALDREDKVSVFIGPKGVGKSAILQMVRCDQRASGNAARLIEIRPDDLAFNALVNVERSMPLLEQASKNKFLLTSLWNYVLCTEILAHEATPTNPVSVLLQRMFGDRHRAEQTQLMRATASENGSSSMTDKMLSLVKAVQIEVDAGGVKGTAKVDMREPAQSSGDELKLLQLVNNVAKALPNTIQHEYFVLIDDLDLHWTGSDLQNAFLGSLFFSIRKLSGDRRIKFVVSLRRNIYREVQLEERDKFADYVETVEWSREAVKRMAQRRIAFFMNVSESQIWGGMFSTAGAFDRIWKYTDGMPREVIRLISHCIKAATHAGASTIGDAHLSRGTLTFSEDRLDELSSLHQYEYPELSVLFKQFRGSPREFSIDRIQEACFAVAELPLPSDRLPNLEWITCGVDDPLSVGRVLLHIGLLLLKDGRKSTAKRATEEDVLLLDNTKWFAIHPMYVFGLGAEGV